MTRVHLPRRRRQPTGILALAVLMAGLVSGSCGDPAPTPVAEEDLMEMKADNVIFGMSSYITKDGVRGGRIEADTAFMFVDSAKLELRGMKIVFYDDDGRERATVTGREGEWSQEVDRMVARGDVLLEVHSDGRTVRSQELSYDVSRDRIWSDSATTMTLPDGTVTTGSSFESDLEFRNMDVRNVRGGARGGP